jgi:hypothetical protein
MQTETYQAGGGPTHGTDGPLKVSLGRTLLDAGKQFLRVARALDPARAQAPSDADTNDLSTINVYTVSVLLVLSSFSMVIKSITLEQRWPRFVDGSP